MCCFVPHVHSGPLCYIHELFPLDTHGTVSWGATYDSVLVLGEERPQNNILPSLLNREEATDFLPFLHLPASCLLAGLRTMGRGGEGKRPTPRSVLTTTLPPTLSDPHSRTFQATPIPRLGGLGAQKQDKSLPTPPPCHSLPPKLTHFLFLPNTTLTAQAEQPGPSD